MIPTFITKFPLFDSVHVLDAAGKTANDGHAYLLPYMRTLKSEHQNRIKLVTETHAVTLEPFESSISVQGTDQQIRDYVPAMLHNAILNDVTRRVLDMMASAGEHYRRAARGRWERFRAWLNPRYVKRHRVASVYDMQNVLRRMLAAISKREVKSNGRGCIVANSRTCVVIMELPDFSAETHRAGLDDSVRFVGSIMGMKVYVDPYMPWGDDRVIMYRSTPENMDGLYVILDSDVVTQVGARHVMVGASDPVHAQIKMMGKVVLVGRASQLDMPECEVAHLKMDICYLP
jgi:hypothetical protein